MRLWKSLILADAFLGHDAWLASLNQRGYPFMVNGVHRDAAALRSSALYYDGRKCGLFDLVKDTYARMCW